LGRAEAGGTGGKWLAGACGGGHEAKWSSGVPRRRGVVLVCLGRPESLERVETAVRCDGEGGGLSQRDWGPHLRRPNLIQWLQMFLPYESLVQALEHTSQ
jgi:hypothetical protein